MKISKAKFTLPFALLSDADETACKLFGVIKQKMMYGKQVRGIERSTFVLDKKGIIRKEWRGLKADGHAQEVLNSCNTLLKDNMPTRVKQTADNGYQNHFVLDTNVLMHDPTSLFRFEEHDVYLPMFVLEELDNNKKGMTEVARNARQASRFLDNWSAKRSTRSTKASPLNALGNKNATGRLYLQTSSSTIQLPQKLATAKPTTPFSAWSSVCKNNNRTGGDPGQQRHQHAHQGARAGAGGAGLFQRQGAGRHRPAVYRRAQLPADFWDRNGKDMKSWQKDGRTYYQISRAAVRGISREPVRVSGKRIHTVLCRGAGAGRRRPPRCAR